LLAAFFVLCFPLSLMFPSFCLLLSICFVSSEFDRLCYFLSRLDPSVVLLSLLHSTTTNQSISAVSLFTLVRGFGLFSL
jgi:hypothetical protein